MRGRDSQLHLGDFPLAFISGNAIFIVGLCRLLGSSRCGAPAVLRRIVHPKRLGERALLPDFPNTKSEFMKAVTERLRVGVYRESALLSRVRRFAAHEGDSFTIHRLDGTVAKSTYRETSAEMTINRKDLVALSPQQLADKIDQLALEMAGKTSKVVFDKLHEITSESGQVRDAKGKPFSPETILEALESIDIDFDEKGQPSGLTFVVGPELGARIREKAPEWEADPEFRRRHSELMQRKREAWRDRESRRKLVN
jgi:hypothetical protein